MIMTKEQLLGSQTARNGFKNEQDIVDKFNNWQTDEDAQKWLLIMQYKLDEIEYVKAVKISQGFKTDVQAQVTIKLKEAIDVQNMQVKLISSKRGFNQIDKRKVDKYTEMWEIPDDISKLLKYYTGELTPYKDSRDKRRMFADELSMEEQTKLLKWIEQNQSFIVSDILKGRGQFAAEWMLVAQKIKTNSRWILKPINYCMNYFGNGEVMITPRGNFRIGKITMQRKGGDGGRESAKLLQFKIDPGELFGLSAIFS